MKTDPNPVSIREGCRWRVRYRITDAGPDAPERSLRIIARQSVSLLHIRDGDAVSCEVLDRCLDVSRYLLDQAEDWLR